MGISCEINTFKHADGVFKPGDSVCGVVNYKLTEETLFNKVIVSLKGLGKLDVYKYTGQVCVSYDTKEKYVDIDNVVLDNTKGILTPAGSHEIPFTFILPEKIPPNFKYKKSTQGYNVDCRISYYIRIKFERLGFLKLNKKFKSKINVANVVSPTLSSPVTYSSVKKPFQLLENKDKVIIINGTVENSVATPRGHVKINYVVNNSTKLNVKGVTIKLNQETKFNCGKHFPDVLEDAKLTECTATPVKAGDTQVLDLIVDIPEDISTMQHSKLVSRNYYITIVADLPMPHRNSILKMPIEVMDKNLDDESEKVGDVAPPSYFEAMEEYEKEDLD